MFDEFWKRYPRKVAKKVARKAWEKLNPDEFTVNDILFDLDRRKWPEYKFIPHPATYLNQERWEDEPEPDEWVEKVTDTSWLNHEST